MSGDDISLPHMLTHLGNLANKRQAELKAVGVEFTVLPMAMNVHSYHNGHSRNAEDLDHTINSLQFSKDDITEMHRAYL